MNHLTSNCPALAQSNLVNETTSANPTVFWPVNVSLVRRGETGRHELERYIHNRYHEMHGANIRQFMPSLLALKEPGGSTVGALGYRPAGKGALFLETYLDSSIEDVLDERLGIPRARSAIVEVGNLTASIHGGARWLIVASTAFLHAMGFRWVVFTATPALLNAFSKLGLNLVQLAPANKARIADVDREWGRYYDVEPVVVVGDSHHAFQVLRNGRLLQRSFATIALWRRAYRLGLLQRNADHSVTEFRWGLET